MDLIQMEKRYKELKKLIQTAEKTGLYEDTKLNQMKKEKLILKEKIAKIKSQQLNKDPK